MKKIICLLAALAFLIVSCSTNDNDSDNGNKITLPKKIKYTNPNSPEKNFTSVIKYNGDKIVSITTDKERTDYIYEGNFIVEVATYDITYNKNDKKSENSYTYTNGKLTSSTYTYNFTSIYPFGQYLKRTIYTYNEDDSIKKEYYSTNAITNIQTKDSNFDVLTYHNGNLIKMIETNGDHVNTIMYDYDMKNNPYKYVLGLNLLLDRQSSGNNLIKSTYSSVSGSSLTVGPFTYKTEYEYNESGYPTKQKNHSQDGAAEINEYFY